ncbi:MAG: cytochrome c [Acidobacteria bacterium]|nr:cytochrome c [Acidobacteriota bacterium]
MRLSTGAWRCTAAAAVLVGTVGAMTAPAVATQSPPPKPASTSAAAMRGEAWFYQRCSLCHMGRIVKDDTYAPMGPRLAGVLKNASADREKLIREQIQRGSPRMPGFQHTFTPAEFEELIAYIKTL